MTNFFQKVIDIIRYKYYYKKHFVVACKKRFAIENNYNKIETLALGSSHAYFAFLPEEETDFNLAMTSQDMYYSYKLYEKYAEKLVNLKNILLFYSVFSPGFELEKTKGTFLCIPYIFEFNIYSKSLIKNIKFIIECIYRSFKFIYYESDTKKNMDSNYRGGQYDEIDPFKNSPAELLTGGGSC